MVITGLGLVNPALAFDTITPKDIALRREPAYARSVLGVMERPDVDYTKG